MAWLEGAELRIGLGCMRLPAEERLARETIAAAAEAGMSVFDTAHAYHADRGRAGDNERTLARTLQSISGARAARIVTKGGMKRLGGAWVPDGRAKVLMADCEASLQALDGLPIDLYLIHAPDPRTPWRTSVRALARLHEQGLVNRVGLANVTRMQLDEALELAPVAAVQVALGPFDDRAARGGVLARCAEQDLTVIAHSPLGGPRRAPALNRIDAAARIAASHGASTAEVALAWLLAGAPKLVAIPGARRPETARSAARAAGLELSEEERAVLRAAFGGECSVGRVRERARARPRQRGEVVVVMGIPGAGKTRLAAGYADRGYVRLNRDVRGGSLRALAGELDRQLEAGIRRAVLDNTYLTRVARSYVVEIADKHALSARCVWLDTPLAQAQVNLVERLVDRFGELPAPEQIREAARGEPWLMLPTSQMRALRELEPPSTDEGFAAVERVSFSRVSSGRARGGVFVAAPATEPTGVFDALADADPAAPHLVFDWVPEGTLDAVGSSAARVASAVSGVVEAATCPHPGGPPSCWCRPPLPGLVLAFAHAHELDPARCTLIGCSRAHLTLATTLGARYVSVV
jgi:aryl-alcohol dehydrogenase-like predicted oxidoreductase/predicted kinase